MKKISIAILLLLSAQLGKGQVARYTSLGVYSERFTDVFSGSTNQAALARVQQAAAGVYGERRFMLKELSNYTAALVWPSKWGGFGLAIDYFGNTNFNTSQVGLGYGKKLGDKIDIGVQFNYNMIKLAGYGGSSAVTVEAGSLWHLTDRLHMGIHVYNPVGGKFGKMNDEKFAPVYTAGIGYEASDKFFISIAIEKEEDRPVNIRAGMQYIFAAHLFAKLDIATATNNYLFGFGIQWKVFRLESVSSWNAQLGLTPGIMLIFNFHEAPQSQADEK